MSVPYTNGIEFSSTRREGATRLIVRLETEAGIVGWGETLCLLDFVRPVLVDVVIPHAIGLKVSQVERLAMLVSASGYYHHERAAVMALSAVELAMWDALGKTLGVPCYELWGGAVRQKVEISAYTMVKDLNTFREHIREMVARRYRTFKIKIGFGEEEDIALIRCAREAIGVGPMLRADVNSVWTIGTAKRILCKTAQCDLQYIEQPLPLSDLSGHAHLRQVQPVPVALDESAYTMGDVGAIIAAGAADALLLDPSEAGGVWEVRKQAAAAASAGLPVGLHSGGEIGPSLGAYLHLAASIPNMWLALDWSAEHLETALSPLDGYLPTEGYLEVPDKPGLGIEIDEALLTKYAVDQVPKSYLAPGTAGPIVPMKASY